MKFSVQKSSIGVWVIRGLVLFPLVFWISMKPLGVRFADLGSTLVSFGQVTGLLGMIAFAITLILSARLMWTEVYFGGIDKMYHVHHTLGVIAFLFLLVHPLALAGNFALLSLPLAAQFLLPGDDLAINLGIFSLLSFMLVIMITMFGKMPYQRLKMIHQTFGFIFFLGAMHAFLIPSDISQHMGLRTYMLGVSGVALAAYVYRTIFGRFFVRTYEYEVVSVGLPVAGVTEVSMKPLGKRMSYEPGQFIFISFESTSVAKEVHPFSISSSPHEDLLRITVKDLGDYTHLLPKLEVGARANIEGPYGHFSYVRNNNKKQIWIAGGIGVTPFLNMARDIAERKPDGYEIDFYYSVRDTSEMIHPDLFAEFEKEYTGLRFIPFVTSEKGFLTADMVSQESGGVFGKDVYLCGPPTMMRSLIAQFLQGGVPRARIHSEAFRML
jgi:predicted ferric reductase